MNIENLKCCGNCMYLNYRKEISEFFICNLNYHIYYDNLNLKINNVCNSWQWDSINKEDRLINGI